MAITFTIRDEGVGIPEKDQKLLFNNYVQIRPGEIQKGKGSGLGLAFCKEIINLYKGKIWVESKEGEGSSFKFTVPFIVPKDDLTTNMSSSDINSQGKSNLGLTHARPEEGWISNIEVMIVDDVVTNCKILSMLFKKKSIKNSTSENGKIALDTIIQDQNKYKIIFMDNLMPEMNGLEASKALRKSGYPYLIIGLTGNVMEDDIQDFVEAGADLVLGKPLQVASLNKILDLVEIHGPYSNSLIFNQSII
jgi:CheY-like chemotaxis protein